LVVGEESYTSARKKMSADAAGTITVVTVVDYVTGNMKEIAKALRLTPSEMCLRLVAEYNKRVAVENDQSLQVIIPQPHEA
jgi:hypothetical protein